MRTLLSKKITLTLFLALGVTAAYGESPKNSNTTSNKVGEFSQKHSAQKKTADSQMKGTPSDIELTRKIRDRLTNDDSLSMSAQNITIVTLNDSVTLKGAVESQAELAKIQNIAKEVAGTKRIENQLKIEK